MGGFSDFIGFPQRVLHQVHHQHQQHKLKRYRLLLFLGFNDQKFKKLKAVKKKSKSDSINSKCQKIRKMLEKFNTEEKREIKVNFVCLCCSSGVFIHSSCVKLFIHDIFSPRSA